MVENEPNLSSTQIPRVEVTYKASRTTSRGGASRSQVSISCHPPEGAGPVDVQKLVEEIQRTPIQQVRKMRGKTGRTHRR